MKKQIATAFVFASNSNPSKTYQTLQYEDGSLSCECPGWTRRVQPDGSRTCRHVRDVEMGFADRTCLKRMHYGEATAPVVPQRRGAMQPTLDLRTGRVFDLSTE